MPDEPTDVAAASSPAPPEVAPAAAEPTPVQERPIENLAAEMNRKFEKFQRQMEAMSQYLASNQSRTPEPAAPKQDVTDDDLWRLAQQGDRNAFDVYMQRIASRTAQTQFQGARRESTVDAQLVALGQKYPVFNDGAHPLTQTVQMAYQLLLQQGYPVGKVTMLDAMKTAIADRPDLVADLQSQVGIAREGARQSASRVAQAGQMGAAHRESPAPTSTIKVKP